MNDEFGDLGRRLRDVYRTVSEDGGPTEEQVLDALATLAAAWSQVAGAMGVALKDPEVREQLKSAAGAFATALGATISGLGAELAREEE